MTVYVKIKNSKSQPKRFSFGVHFELNVLLFLRFFSFFAYGKDMNDNCLNLLKRFKSSIRKITEIIAFVICHLILLQLYVIYQYVHVKMLCFIKPIKKTVFPRGGSAKT